MCVLTATSGFKRSSFAPLQPLNNGPGPLKWSLMEALMGGGTHSYSIFHPAIPPPLQMAQRKCLRTQAFRSPGNCADPEGMRLRVIQIILGLPSPHPFLICINTKQEQCGVKTNHGVWQAGSSCLDPKNCWVDIQKVKHASCSPTITCSANLNQSHQRFSCKPSL